jgi:RNA polymerase sigma-70 factor (ECF subfamily)
MNAARSLPLGVLSAAALAPCADGAGGLTGFRRLLECVWMAQAHRLAALAAALGLPRDVSADVLQDVYVTALRQPPAIDNEVELLRWLFRVTANRAKLEHRRRGRWRRLWQTLAIGWRDDVPAVACSELNLEVKRALTTLADEDRTLVAMRYFAELNSREIGEIVGLPEATVRGRLRAARQQLAQELADWEDD